MTSLLVLISKFGRVTAFALPYLKASPHRFGKWLMGAFFGIGFALINPWGEHRVHPVGVQMPPSV